MFSANTRALAPGTTHGMLLGDAVGTATVSCGWPTADNNFLTTAKWQSSRCKVATIHISERSSVVERKQLFWSFSFLRRACTETTVSVKYSKPCERAASEFLPLDATLRRVSALGSRAGEEEKREKRGRGERTTQQEDEDDSGNAEVRRQKSVNRGRESSWKKSKLLKFVLKKINFLRRSTFQKRVWIVQKKVFFLKYFSWIFLRDKYFQVGFVWLHFVLLYSDQRKFDGFLNLIKADWSLVMP